MEDEIKALMIYEILGKPPEYIIEAMNNIIDALARTDGVELIKKNIHEPKQCTQDELKGLFTTFAEVEIKTKDIDTLMVVIFNSMPSHIEIIEPSEIIIKNFQLGSFFSSMITKLHKYDEVVKAIGIERSRIVAIMKQMEEKLKKYEGDTKKPGEGDEDIHSVKNEKEDRDKKKDKLKKNKGIK
jgi:hypothetical protein